MPEQKMVQISESDLAELRKLQDANTKKKAKSTGRSKARQELIKRHKPEYDRLVAEFGGGA